MKPPLASAPLPPWRANLLDPDDALVLDLVRRGTLARIDCADWRADYTTDSGERAGHRQRQATTENGPQAQ
jgi:hypothetical protein